jgi:hypothetical protein
MRDKLYAIAWLASKVAVLSMAAAALALLLVQA